MHKKAASGCRGIRSPVYHPPADAAHPNVASAQSDVVQSGTVSNDGSPALLRGAKSPAARVWFWVRRYGPAELGCLVTMLAASVLAARVADSPALLAIAAIACATVGFYGVLIVTVLREQLEMLPRSPGRARRALARSVALLAAEFGLAEILDTFFYRPLLMMAGVIVLGDPLWGLIAGKIVSDVVFYAISAVCFRVTERTGIRMPRLRVRPLD